jgi:opacity protein-like surface antigen
LLCAALFAAFVAVPARAELSLGAGGEVAIPWDGDAGWGASVEALYRLPERGWRFGGEFEYRHYQSGFFGANNIDVDSYQIRLIAHYLFDLGPVWPYLGVGLHTAVNVIDDEAIEAQVAFANVDESGTSIGATAIAGLEIPLFDFLSVFGEARVGVDAQLTEEDEHCNFCDDDDVGVEELGGFAGRGGVRIRF